MAYIVENGGGVRNANAYQTIEAITAYLTERERQTENGWDTLTSLLQRAASIAATDYIDRVHGPNFLGRREHTFEGAMASGSITVTGIPTDGEFVTVGAVVLTFRSVPLVLTDVAIGASSAASAANLQLSIESNVTGFTSAVVVSGVVTITSDVDGSNGNFINLLASGVNLTAATFSGGVDGGDQPREFPRVGLKRRDGTAVIGLPVELLHAHAEYTVRAAAGSLEADPTIPSAGQGPIIEIRTRVEGAIDKSTRWATPEQAAGSVVLQPYPAADQLLSDFVRRASIFGRVGRA